MPLYCWNTRVLSIALSLMCDSLSILCSRSLNEFLVDRRLFVAVVSIIRSYHARHKVCHRSFSIKSQLLTLNNREEFVLLAQSLHTLPLNLRVVHLKLRAFLHNWQQSFHSHHQRRRRLLSTKRLRLGSTNRHTRTTWEISCMTDDIEERNEWQTSSQWVWKLRFTSRM